MRERILFSEFCKQFALFYRVAEYIPARPKFPKRTDGAQRAVSDFHSQVANVAQLVLAELRYVKNY